MKYRLLRLADSEIVIRDDNATIPADPANTDWQAYQAWLADGNTPAEPAPSLRPSDALPPARSP